MSGRTAQVVCQAFYNPGPLLCLRLQASRGAINGAGCCLQAMEIVSLKDRLAEAEEGRVEVRQKLGETFADVHRLEALVMRLEQDVDSARL